MSGAKVAVIGLGVSGVAAARLALNKKGSVYVSDLHTDPQTAARAAELRNLGARVDLGRHDREGVENADLVVVSPGVPPQAPVLRSLTRGGRRWISEPEFAVRFYRGPLIAITGTNGKTTTSMLTAHLLRAAGLDVALGGNVGGGLAPAASDLALRASAPAWYVLELSSFQLAGIDRLRADIGVVTNLAPDHLDRYDSVADYFADKGRIFRNADGSSRWVLPQDDEAVESLAEGVPGRRFHFGQAEGDGCDAYMLGDALVLEEEGVAAPLIEQGELSLLGRHNRLNALAAALTVRLAGGTTRDLAAGLRDAEPLPHRLEPVAEHEGVLWVNDSKATNVAATRSALESLERPVVLLVGGKDKGEDFRGLRASMGGVKAAVVFGAARSRLSEALAGAAPLLPVEGGMEEVCRAARRAAASGDIVLLSPACSSFDMFDDYEHRGRRFSEVVRASC